MTPGAAGRDGEMEEGHPWPVPDLPPPPWAGRCWTSPPTVGGALLARVGRPEREGPGRRPNGAERASELMD